MQLYYIITKYDTEQIRFQKTEVEKFSQNIAKGFDTWIEVKKEMEKRFLDYTHSGGRYELIDIERGRYTESIKRMVFNEPEFVEDAFGHKSRQNIEIFIAKAVV